MDQEGKKKSRDMIGWPVGSSQGKFYSTRATEREGKGKSLQEATQVQIS